MKDEAHDSLREKRGVLADNARDIMKELMLKINLMLEILQYWSRIKKNLWKIYRSLKLKVLNLNLVVHICPIILHEFLKAALVPIFYESFRKLDRVLTSLCSSVLSFIRTFFFTEVQYIFIQWSPWCLPEFGCLLADVSLLN